MEKRIHPRRGILRPVVFDVNTVNGEVESVDAEMLDISAGGLCIKADKIIEPGKVVRLKVSLDGMGVHVPSIAEVKWAGSAEGRDEFEMGLQFLV